MQKGIKLMTKEQEVNKQSNDMEHITLDNDTGSNISFVGRLVGEHSYFDEETQTLTQQKLYVTSETRQAYSVVTSDGKNKQKRAYLIKREGQLCKINNGLFDVTVNAVDLLAVVKGLCGGSDAITEEEFFCNVQNPDVAANG